MSSCRSARRGVTGRDCGAVRDALLGRVFRSSTLVRFQGLFRVITRGALNSVEGRGWGVGCQVHTVSVIRVRWLNLLRIESCHHVSAVAVVAVGNVEVKLNDVLLPPQDRSLS